MVKEDTDLRELHRQLEKVKTEAKKEYDPGKIKIDQTVLDKRIAQSRPMIDLNQVEVDKKWLEALFKEYLSVLKKAEKGEGKAPEKLEKSFQRKELDLEVLAKKVFSVDTEYLEKLAQKLAVDVDDLYFLGLRLGNPLFELYAGKVGNRIDQERWLKGFCPVCGSSPAMAYLRKDDGKRILWCKFCGTKWSFLRLKCPFCSNEDQKTLRYFFTDQNDPYRVHVCDKCRKYIKTLDQRRMEKPEDLDLGWENLNTFALDLAAEKEGFFSPYSRPPGQKKGVII